MTRISDCAAAILAGGLATRLKPLTEKIPKSLIPIAGRPFIHYQIELLRACGVKHLVLCTGHLGGLIEEALGDGEKFGVHIDYSPDGDRLLGTGGALCKSLPYLSEPFFVLYGDSYLPIDYQEVTRAYDRSRKLGLMTVYQNKNRWGKSNVWFDGKEIKAYNKRAFLPQMKHIDYGFSVFSKKVFQNSKTNEKKDLSEIFSELLSKRQLAGHEVSQRFFEIGSPEGLAELEAMLKSK